jgi:hypothetical protein
MNKLLESEAFAGTDSWGGAACRTGAIGHLVNQRVGRVGPTGPRACLSTAWQEQIAKRRASSVSHGLIVIGWESLIPKVFSVRDGTRN